MISEDGPLSPDFKESPQITARGKGTADHEKESKNRTKTLERENDLQRFQTLELSGTCETIILTMFERQA